MRSAAVTRFRLAQSFRARRMALSPPKPILVLVLFGLPFTVFRVNRSLSFFIPVIIAR